MNRAITFAVGLFVGVVTIIAFNRLNGGATTGNTTIESGNNTAMQSTQADSAANRSPLANNKEVTPAARPIAFNSSDNIDENIMHALVERLTDAEQRITELELTLAEITFSDDQAEEEQLEETPLADLETRLLESGIDSITVNEIKAIRNDAQLQRLELRDRATREGWIDSDRFRESFTELNSSSRLRQSLGDDDYDQLLLAEGRRNRVRIDEVIDNSAAAIAGIEAGDILYSYAGERIFTFRDLRSATTSGTKDQPVTAQVVRDSNRVDFIIPRGPLGVTISPVIFDDSE